ncbi:unnamed protein product [Rotaria sordida]|uniref:histone acetyltransferase n=1 Tax=Rotaria sordida TaxID=392033 RepID=A0A814JY62_9BILA|nr:unnamed protein product [Rotaria sordida]
MNYEYPEKYENRRVIITLQKSIKLSDTNSIRIRYQKHRYRNYRRMQTSFSLPINTDVINTESIYILPNSNLSITFRFLRPGDQFEVKSLCHDWFPIEYPDKWYNDIVQNKKYFALAACDNLTQNIIALIIANIIPLNNCSREDQQILHKKFLLTTSVCYILILDAYCFARYINGGYPPFTISDFFSNVWIYLMRANPCHLFNTIRYFVKNKFIFSDSYQRTSSSYKQISRII